MGWQQIHNGGWVCSYTGDYQYTGGGSPDPDLCLPPDDPRKRGAEGDDWVQIGPGIWYYPPTGEYYYESTGSSSPTISDETNDCDAFRDGTPVGEVMYLQCMENSGPTVGGGGGGGRVAPKYVKPDEATVRDSVKATLVALTGKYDAARVDMLVDTYMGASREAFDKRESQQVDPMQAVKAKIRGFGDYQRIHQLRPEEMDEFEWVGSRQSALINLGVESNRAIDLGVDAAQAGLSVQDTAEQGQVQEFARTGQARFGLEDKLRNSARAGIGLLR